MQENKKSLRIVIADNESLIRLDIREMLEDAGHEVVGEAVNGRRAVELTRQHRPDLVLMDIKMPEMDGITAAGKIYAGLRRARVSRKAGTGKPAFSRD